MWWVAFYGRCSTEDLQEVAVLGVSKESVTLDVVAVHPRSAGLRGPAGAVPPAPRREMRGIAKLESDRPAVGPYLLRGLVRCEMLDAAEV